MAVGAALTLELLATVDTLAPSTPTAVPHKADGSQRWTNGTGSGKVDRVYHATGALVASASVTFNLLAAGALKDPNNVTVDLDELKGLVVKCLTGTFEVVAASANGLACFTGASEGIVLTAGQSFGINLGATGLVIGSNASLTLTELSTTLGATYEIELVGAE